MKDSLTVKEFAEILNIDINEPNKFKKFWNQVFLYFTVLAFINDGYSSYKVTKSEGYIPMGKLPTFSDCFKHNEFTITLKKDILR